MNHPLGRRAGRPFRRTKRCLCVPSSDPLTDRQRCALLAAPLTNSRAETSHVQTSNRTLSRGRAFICRQAALTTALFLGLRTLGMLVYIIAVTLGILVYITAVPLGTLVYITAVTLGILF